MNRRLVALSIAVLTAGLVLELSLPALADERDISVGGVLVCRITQDVSGYTSYQRAAEVRKRITEVLSNPKFRQGGVAVEVRPAGDDALITVGGTLVFTVTREDTMGDSVAPHMTPLEVARQWAARLADGLSRALPDTDLHTF
jgi:hypothetical protein